MKMKSMRSRIIKKNVALLAFFAAILCISQVAIADAVLDWNAIAVDTAVANGQDPFARGQFPATRVLRLKQQRSRLRITCLASIFRIVRLLSITRLPTP